MYFLFTFVISLATWIVFSGKFDLFHLMLGVFSCLLVAYFSSEYLFADKSVPLSRRLAIVPKVMRYTVWLLYQVFVANLQVFFLAFHPRVLQEIQPQIIRFQTQLQTEFAKFVLGNSITLTPGTVTVTIVESEFTVHAIDPKLAQGIAEMERRIADIFEK